MWARPNPHQRSRPRAPHHLLDLRDPDQPITLQEFQAAAEPCIAQELERHGIALLVGGSGLYLKALTDGLKPPAVAPQPALRAQLQQLGQAICHPLLQQSDPTAAAKIAPADAVRTQRALEVLYGTGRPISSQASATPPPWRVLELGLNPANLRERIGQRTRTLYGEVSWRKRPAWPSTTARTYLCCRRSATARRCTFLMARCRGRRPSGSPASAPGNSPNANAPGFGVSTTRTGSVTTIS